MQYSLIFAVAIAVLGFASAAPPRGSNEEKVCGFLKDMETRHHMLLDTTKDKAYELGKSAIKLLPKNSGFKDEMEDELEGSTLTQNAERMIAFLKKFKCAFKRHILCNTSYRSRADFQDMYDGWSSESDDLNAVFDSGLIDKTNALDERLDRAAFRIMPTLVGSIKAYLDLPGYQNYGYFNDLLKSAKSKYKCTYMLYFL